MSGKGAYYKNLYGGAGRRASVGGTNVHAEHYGGIQKHSLQGASRAASSSDRTLDDLERAVHRLEGRSYPSYRDISGAWHSKLFTFFLDYIQSDPYAPPSKARVRVNHQHANFPADLFGNHVRKVALCDFLTRSIHRALQYNGETPSSGAQSRGWSSAKGGDMNIDCPKQHVLQRTSVVISDSFAEARFTMALPARGRTILGHQAAHMVEADIPRIAAALMYDNHDKPKLKAFVDSIEDQETLRELITEAGLSAFVANGAILPRDSGASDAPMSTAHAVPFVSPPHLEQTFQLPHHGPITGMAIPKGITLIAGGGFHGKSTLLDALSNGCYNKIPGDGREFVVTSSRATAIRGEDGRSVENVDISPFINNLPLNKPTTSFSTEDASGSTSMAAGVVEALELGTDTLLLDEDTCATNFLIRDRRMQLLISSEHEPITPLIFKIRSLYRDHGCSTILVVGGCGVFCDVADLVLQMRNYQCVDITEKARQIAKDVPSGVLETEESENFGKIRPRALTLGSLAPHDGGKIVARGVNRIQHGEGTLDLKGVTQLVHLSQTNAIAAYVDLLRRGRMSSITGDKAPLKEVLRILEEACDGQAGLDAVSQDRIDGFLARPRAIDVGMAINRLRGAQLEYGTPKS